MGHRSTYSYLPIKTLRKVRKLPPKLSLIGLPEDIRQRIWKAVLLDSFGIIPLLQTCRQIHAEAQPLVFTKPLYLRSQTDLERWLGKVELSYAYGVRTLHLTVQDLDCLPLSGTGYQFWPSLPLLKLYQAQTKRIVAMLVRFPNITEFHLSKPKLVRSYLYDYFYFSILRRVTTKFQHLAALTCYCDEHSLDFAKGLPNLRRLSFTGYSRSEPGETSNILSQLHNLEELEIVLPCTPTIFGGFELEHAFPKSQSITKEVIKDFRGLKTFTLRERKDERDRSPSFCTTKFIQALNSRHRATLQVLKIDLDFTPDAACQRAIRALCSASNLRHIDLCWPGMRGDELHALPRSLITLRTSPPPGRPPYWVLLVAAWRRVDLPNLKQLFLAGDLWSTTLSSRAINTQAFKSAKAAVAALGIETFIEPELGLRQSCPIP